MNEQTPGPGEPDPDEADLDDYDQFGEFDGDDLGPSQDDVPGEPPHPVNWNCSLRTTWSRNGWN